MGYLEQYNYWLSDPYFDEKTKEELREIAGFSLGGVLGIGVEIPLTSSLCLGFQNSYTSGYTSKSGSLKKMFNYYNCFDINLLLSLIYAIPVHDR